MNKSVSELTYISKEFHGPEWPRVSLCFQQFLCSAYGPVHTSFSTLIEGKPRFCSKPCFKGREDQTLWKSMWKAISSGWFLMQLLESSALFSLANQAGFVVRLDLV